MGFRKEKDGKNIKFLDFSDAIITIPEGSPFTVDGEKIVLSGRNELKILNRNLKLIVY